MIEYDVIEGHFLPGILGKVRAAIEAGWEPIGGVAVTHCDGDSRYFYQAMTRQRQPGPPIIPFPHPVRPPSPTVRSSR
jgi:hypothetical protein